MQHFSRVAGLGAATLALSALTLGTAAPAGAASGAVTAGATQWGLSTYLNSANPGRPNPLASAYGSPSTFDATTRVSTWGTGAGTVGADGAAELRYTGTTVNFASTGGGWLRLRDLQVALDPAGNGTVSAVVSYGTSTTGNPGALTYDPSQAPARGPERVDVVDLAANTAGDRTQTGLTTTWAGLDGTWAPELLDFVDGDSAASPAIPAWSYATTITNTGAADRRPSPFTFSATTGPVATVSTVSTSPPGGLALRVSGTNFSPVTQTGDAGVYAGLAPSGGLPDVTSQAGMSAFAASAWVMPGQFSNGAFTTTLTAPASALDPTKAWSVYTWQAHSHSNTTQDTETPVSIDWAALRPASAPATTPTTVPAPTSPAATAATTVRASWKTKATRTRAGKLKVALATAAGAKAPGTVKVVLRKSGTTRKLGSTAVRNGVATVAVPRLARGTWKVVLTYGGQPGFAPARQTMKLVVR